MTGLLPFTVREDLPELRIRTGDIVFCDPEPGWQDDGPYVMCVKWDDDDWESIGLDDVKVRTKTGALRKRITLNQWMCRPDEDFRILRPHRVRRIMRNH